MCPRRPERLDVRGSVASLVSASLVFLAALPRTEQQSAWMGAGLDLLEGWARPATFVVAGQGDGCPRTCRAPLAGGIVNATAESFQALAGGGEVKAARAHNTRSAGTTSSAHGGSNGEQQPMATTMAVLGHIAPASLAMLVDMAAVGPSIMLDVAAEFLAYRGARRGSAGLCFGCPCRAPCVRRGARRWPRSSMLAMARGCKTHSTPMALNAQGDLSNGSW